MTSQEHSIDEVSFSHQNLEFQFLWELCKRKNLPLFVENERLYSAIGAVTCLVTFLTFVEVRLFTLHSYNRYRSYVIYSHLL